MAKGPGTHTPCVTDECDVWDPERWPAQILASDPGHGTIEDRGQCQPIRGQYCESVTNQRPVLWGWPRPGPVVCHTHTRSQIMERDNIGDPVTGRGRNKLLHAIVSSSYWNLWVSWTLSSWLWPRVDLLQLYILNLYAGIRGLWDAYCELHLHCNA